MMVMSTISSALTAPPPCPARAEFGSKLYRPRPCGRSGSVEIPTPREARSGGAAAAGGTGRGGHALDLVLRLEGAAAAACRDDVRVVDLEPGAHQPVDVVD